jgi:hypothetical protein
MPVGLRPRTRATKKIIYEMLTPADQDLRERRARFSKPIAGWATSA